MSILFRNLALGSALTLLGSCVEDIPTAGKPCPNGDVDCDDGDSSTAFFCSVVDGNTCLPGVGLEPAENLLPIVHATAIVAGDGSTVRGAFSAVDPDGRGDVVFSLGEALPSNGTIYLDTDGSYAFTANLNGGATAQSRFQIIAIDSDGGETIASAFAVVLNTDVGDLLTWSGAKSSDFIAEENWSPSMQPTSEFSVFLPSADSFSPTLFDDGEVFNLYIGPGRDFGAGGLEIFGDEVFSASADVQGPLYIESDPHIIGDLPGLQTHGGAHIDAQVRIAGDLRLSSVTLPFTLHDGASLTVEGTIAQSGDSLGFAVAETDVDATVRVNGDLLLLGARSAIGRSTLIVAGHIQVASAILAEDDARLIFAGKATQLVSISSTVRLPAMTSLPNSRVRFVGDGRVDGNFDVGGELSIEGGGHLRIASTLTLRSSFNSGSAVDGRLTAAACVVSPDITVPDWIECDVPYDSGLPIPVDAGIADAGADDAGDLDAGDLDAGDLDAGDLDAGDLDAGDLDAGDFDAGDLDAGAFDAGDFDAGDLDAGDLDAGDLDAGDFDAGDFDAGDFDAGDFDAGDFDAGDFDAGDFDAGAFDAGTFDAGSFDAGVPLTDCVAPSLRTGGVVRGLIVVEAGTSTSTDIGLADADAAGDFSPHDLEIDGGNSQLSANGNWAFSALPLAVGYYDVPVSYPAAGAVAHDCIRVRVVNPGLEFNVVKPAATVTVSGLFDWHEATSWASGVVPDATTTVFIPKAYNFPTTPTHIDHDVRKFLIETGAGFLIKKGTMKVSEEVALGAGTLFEPAQVVRLGPAPTQLASAVPIESLECNNNVITLASRVQLATTVIPRTCSLDVGVHTLHVDGDLTGESLTYPSIQAHSPASRLIVDGNLDVGFLYTTGLTAGTTVVRGNAVLTLVVDGPPVTGSEHTLILVGDGAQSLTSNGTLGRVEVLAPATTLTLSAFDIESIDLGSTTLCVDVGGGSDPVVGEVMTTSGFDYAGGPAWTVDTCSGAACATLESGGTAASCQ